MFEIVRLCFALLMIISYIIVWHVGTCFFFLLISGAFASCTICICLVTELYMGLYCTVWLYGVGCYLCSSQFLPPIHHVMWFFGQFLQVIIIGAALMYTAKRAAVEIMQRFYQLLSHEVQ